MKKQIKIALADDHVLLRDALASLIDQYEDCKVICRSVNGKELIEFVKKGGIPDVAILDLNMPVMDGYETASWLKENFPDTQVLMLTMYDSEIAMIRLLQAGVKGFLKKDVHPDELKYAIQSVIQNGFYYSHFASGKLANLFRKDRNNNMTFQKSIFSDQEVDFLKLSCTELTYKEIATKMKLNPRAIDNLRDNLFEKIEVKSRVGLAMYAIKNGLMGF
ncbi:MAG: response regulator transcription factor [Flavihumibacter sp.]|nr:response regulator transcription factor [Flavihumibacter sp.]